MTPEQFAKYRILFYKNGCSHCAKYMYFIGIENQKLKVGKRFLLIECSSYSYGIVPHPLFLLLNKHIKGFPILFLDGIIIDGANSRIEIESFLKSFLQNDYIIYEHNNFKYEADCETETRGLFKGRIKCK